MKKLTLILFLRNDSNNSLAHRISYLQKNKMLQPLEGRDDVIQVSDNAVLVDQNSAHGIFVQLCAGLVEGDWPYLLVPIDAETTVATGKFLKKVQDILSSHGISA